MGISQGTKLGVYEILAPLGAGGMGEVYRAHDTKLHRDVALKVLPPQVAGDPERLARFRREAQVLASLNHPHIAQIHGFEDSGDTHALVMELVEGPTIAERIEKGPIPLAEALAISRQIVDALEAAHNKGIVHRDLKPANVKVKDDGDVKVLDFGLAKAADPASGESADLSNSPTLTARATQLGVILGTAAYMAPEQAKGRAVDKRADIWAFGVVLFEMLTGQRAFKGEDASDVLAAVLRQDMDWSMLPTGTPPAVRRLLQRCLERDPKKRLRDIGDAFFELDAPIEPATPAAVVPPPRRSAFGTALPWAASAVVAGVAITWALLHTPAAPAALVMRSESLPKDPLLLLSLSSDGTRLAYNTVAGGAPSVALRMMDQFEAKTVPGTNGAAFPIFSPDGQWIAYNTLDSPRRIRKIPITGGASVPICDGDFLGGAAWGGDDTIVFGAAKGLMRVAAGGGTPDSLTLLDAAKGEIAHTRPQFLPGGRQLLFTVSDKTGAHFAVLDLGSRQYKVVANGGVNGRYVRSGHLTFVREGTLFAVPFDLGALAAGSEVPVVEGVSMSGPEGTGDYAVSDAGLLVYINTDEATQGTTLVWTDRKGKSEPMAGQSRQPWGTGRLSPDGTRVANAISAAAGGTADIVVFDTAKGTSTRLTFAGDNDYPIWSPNGRRIVYRGLQDGKSAIYAVDADGSGKPQKLKDTEAVARLSSFAADGKSIVYDVTLKGQASRIFVLPIDPIGEPRPLHDSQSSEWNGQVSPDGRWISYESGESGTRELYVQPFPGPGPKVRISSQGGARARWSRDGRVIYFWGGVPSTQFFDVAVTPGAQFQAGTPQELFQGLSGTTWDVTPDRNKFLTELTTSSAAHLAIVTNWFEELRKRAPAKK